MPPYERNRDCPLDRLESGSELLHMPIFNITLCSWGCPVRFSVMQVDEDLEGRNDIADETVGSGEPSGDGIAEEEDQTGQDDVEEITAHASYVTSFCVHL